MREVQLRAFTEDDLTTFRQWLKQDYIKKWYSPVEDWIKEVKNVDGEFDFVTHLMVYDHNVSIGFCQYYPFDQSGEDWNGTIPMEGTYSIDYLIGDPQYLRKGYGCSIIKQLTEMVMKLPDVRRIIVQPNQENTASRQALLSAGYTYVAKEDVFLYN